MSSTQGKPTISPGTVLFLWAFMAILSCGIALQSILAGSNETLASLISWDRIPQFIEARFEPAPGNEQVVDANTPSGSEIVLSSRVAEIDEQLETVTRSIGSLQRDNNRIQESRISTASRIDRLESSFDSITGSLPPSASTNRDESTQILENQSSGGISFNYTPYPIDGESSGDEMEMVPGSVQRTEFAVIVARSPDRASLSRIWTMLQEEHGERFDKLMPRIQIEASADNGVQHALVAGPLRNAQMAIELCARLSLSSSTCQPIQYGGDMLPEMTSSLEIE